MKFDAKQILSTHYSPVLDEFLLEKLLVSSEDLKFNGSVVAYNDVIYCSYRTNFLTLTKGDAKNYLTAFSSSFVPMSHKKLVATNGNSAFEDVRLFVYQDTLMALYHYIPGNVNVGWTWSYGIGIGVINIHTGEIEKQQSLRPYSSRSHDKNWVPLIEDGELYLVTDHDPLVKVLKVIGSPGKFKCEIASVTSNLNKWQYGELRGGTPYFCRSNKSSPWQYSFIHSSLTVPDGNWFSKFYFYTISRYNLKENLFEIYKTPLYYSEDDPSLVLTDVWHSTGRTGIRVVFPMGVLVSEEGVVLSFGKDDAVTRMKYYKWDFIENLFATQKDLYPSIHNC